uniref:Uncharacterized protein n=1 Tax=Lotus japonicus TaxID=34305 RepID=I3SL34_LOTJA|nr:unknown [Lotus japonicus]
MFTLWFQEPTQLARPSALSSDNAYTMRPTTSTVYLPRQGRGIVQVLVAL